MTPLPSYLSSELARCHDVAREVGDSLWIGLVHLRDAFLRKFGTCLFFVIAFCLRSYFRALGVHRYAAFYQPVVAALRDFGRCGRSLFCVCLGLVFSGISSSGLAFELYDGIQIHGFVTQGLFHTSDNNMIGPSADDISPDFTEIGVNGSWTPLPKLRFSVQLLSRRAGEGQDGSPELDFGLVDYSPFDTSDYRLGLRLGRVRLPYGLYNDTRDMAFTRPSILLPQSIYPERTRNLTISADGAVFYGEKRSPWGTLTFEFGSAVPRVDDRDTELAILNANVPGHLDPELAYIGRLSYDLDDGRLKLAVTGAHVVTQYDPKYGPSQDLLPGEDSFTPWVFSAQYNTEHWTLTSEYSLRAIKKSGFGPERDYDIIGEAYYFQAAYRFASNWELMARYDALFNDREDRYGKRLEAATNGFVPARSQFAEDWTVGIRYDVTPWLMLRAEYNYVNGTAWLPIQDNPDRSATTQHWDMYSFLVSLRF